MKVHMYGMGLLAALVSTLLIAGIAAAQDTAGSTEAAPEGEGANDTMIQMGPPPGYDGHHVCWLEFAFKEQAATVKFYEDLFGWKFIPYEKMENYVFYQTASGVMGGFNGQGFGEMQNTIFYIYVPDVDAALAEVEAAGGKTLVPKMPVEESGSIALFTDPAGVTVGLADMYMYEPSPNPMDGAKPAVNTICYLEIFGGDFAKTSEFYSKVFGWTTTPSPHHEEYLGFASGGGADGVFQSHTPDIPVVAYIWVDDVAATLAKIKEAGGEPYGEATPTPMGVFGYFKDPSGIWM